MSYDKAATLRAIGPGRWVVPAIVLDLVLITALSVLARAMYGFDIGYVVTVYTAWPFLAGALLGWLVARAWRRPLELASTGIPIWLLTVAVGVALRLATGEPARIPFVIVATLLLGVALLGWRAIAKRVALRHARRVLARVTAPGAASAAR
jgi:hypothetical protein